MTTATAVAAMSHGLATGHAEPTGEREREEGERAPCSYWSSLSPSPLYGYAGIKAIRVSGSDDGDVFFLLGTLMHRYDAL